jgi:hypothetical protein
MPTIIKYRKSAEESLAVLLNSDFTQNPDGYLEIPLRFLVTPFGLKNKVLDNLQPKAGDEMPPFLYQRLRSLPPNKGLFVNKSHIYYKNGFLYADVQCSSCETEAKAIVNTETESKVFSGSVTIDLGNNEKETRYWSFLMKTPTVTVRTTHLANERARRGVTVSLQGNPRVTVGQKILQVRAKGTSANIQFQPTNVINRNTLRRSNSFWQIIESESSINDGSVVRTTLTYSLSIESS